MHVEPTYILRDATADDAQRIAEIRNETVLSGDVLRDDDFQTADGIVQLIEGFDRRETVLILEGGQEIFGWAVVKRYRDGSGYRFSAETSVFLRRKYVGRGYGTYLKRALIERCRDYGYHHLVARVLASDRRSIDYNLELGYEWVGIQKEIGYKDDRWEDVAILQLVLKDVAPEIPATYA